MIDKLNKIKIENLQFLKTDEFDNSEVKAETSIFGFFDI